MLRKTQVAAAVAGISAASVMAVGPAFAVSGTAGRSGSEIWRIVKQLPANARVQFPEVSAVTAVGSSGAWAFDSSIPAPFMLAPTAWELRGTAWTRMPFPGRDDEIVVAAGASSASNVWAFTNNLDQGGSRALRWNGSSWSVLGTFPAKVTPAGREEDLIDGAVVLGPGNVWIFDGQATLHWNGSKWLPAKGGNGLLGGNGHLGGSLWAFAGTDVARWTGEAWARTSLAGLLPRLHGVNPSITGIYVQSGNSVYAVATTGTRQTVLHDNGRTWSRATQLSTGHVVSSNGQITGDGHGGFWIPTGTNPALLHYSDGRLTVASLPLPAREIYVDAVSLIPGTSEVLAGGSMDRIVPDGGPFSTAVILKYTP